MKYTFIICTYNRAESLAYTLKAVCEQTICKDRYEVIVIDNNSTDNTPEVYKACEQKYAEVKIRYVKETNQGLSFALNRGIEETRGEYIIYVDDDETLDKDHLEKLDAYLIEYPFIELAGTRVVPVYETEKPKWISFFTQRLMTGHFYMGEHVRLLKTKDYPGTGHTIIKKELYDRFGLFNTNLGRKGLLLTGAEDKDMCLRLINNYVRCYYLPDMIIYHHIPQSKLTNDYFSRLTYAIGQSERMRTKSISKFRYAKRLMAECIKWAASIILFIAYTLALKPDKGWKLIQFRWNVSKGLLG